jgi:N-acetyl-gamma-glutamyl-phosphate reductase
MAGKIRAAILGASGYSGFELARLLLRHPGVETPTLLGRSGEADTAADLAAIYPLISGNGGYPLQRFSWAAVEQEKTELLFLATPHEISRTLVPEAMARRIRVIDLSGAWRLRQAEPMAAYGFQDGNRMAAAQLTAKAVYGLPELHRERIRSAELVANPGCYATSIILALAPLVAAGVVDRQHGIVSDSKSGVSGAGKEPTSRTHFVSVADNLSAYSVFGHRHLGEILEQLQLEASEIVFAPHLVPIPRGILSTIYVQLTCAMDAAEVESCFRDYYRDQRWVRLFATPQLPQIQFSLRTNYCDLGFCLADDKRRLVLVSCLDNLLKGAAGQAVQNMNLMYGWREEAGLE